MQGQLKLANYLARWLAFKQSRRTEAFMLIRENTLKLSFIIANSRVQTEDFVMLKK